MYNPISCSGWDGAGSGWMASLPCLKSRVGIVLLFFILAIVRKWGGEEMGLDYSLLFGAIAGIVLYLLMVIITGNVAIALVVGIVAGVFGGYMLGSMFGSGD